MDYRDMLGFPKKPKKSMKEVEKKVAPKSIVPPVTELLKKEFGPLNEWGKVDTGPKRWSSAYTAKDGLTEFERKGGKDSINEVDFEKVKIPSQVKRFLAKFVDSVKSAGLNRIKRSAVLYQVIDALGISPQQLMADIQKIKKEL